jgi:hypothetical protein
MKTFEGNSHSKIFKAFPGLLIFVGMAIYQPVGLRGTGRALASPMPPSARCQIEAEGLKDLGKISLFHKDLFKTPKEERPFQCKDAETSKEFLWPSYEVKVLKSKTLREGYSASSGCPKVGSTLTVSYRDSKLPPRFRAEWEYRGDECFAGNFIEQVEVLK